MSPECANRGAPRALPLVNEFNLNGLEWTISRVWGVDPARRSGWNQLYGYGARINLAFVSDDVNMTATVVHKGHPLCVFMGFAIRVVPFVSRDCSRCYHD